MSLQKSFPFYLTDLPEAESWIPAPLLKVATRAATVHRVGGRSWLISDEDFLIFNATTSSDELELEHVNFRFGLPRRAFGVETRRVHSVGEVLGELAFLATSTAYPRTCLVRLIGEDDANELVRLAGQLLAQA